ncbi:MAG: VWA domain-containing protein [Spirochaetales bacterium]|nr:VWA domain-containing protein [Spirochaetales bacterium]
MNKKNFILLSLFTLTLFLPIIAFTQPSIALSGATLNDGFSIQNSNKIIFAFNRTMASTDTEISITLPTGVSTFTVRKDGAICPIDGATDCTGSFIIVTTSNPGALTILDFGETAGTSLFEVTIEAQAVVPIGSCDWQINPIGSSNADMQYARAIPDITIDPLIVVSGQINAELDTTSTVPVSSGTIAPAPAISSYAWSYSGGLGIILTDATTSTPTFNAPAVTTYTEVSFDLTVTDNAGLSATEAVIVPIRPPVDAVVLMDTSGSMGWYHDGSTHDLAGGCCSRLASAKAASNYFVERLGTLTTDSRLGVAIFPAEPAPSTNYGDEWNALTALPSGAVISSIQTAIGGETETCADCSTPPGTPGTPTGIQVNWNGTPTRYGLDAAAGMFPIAAGDYRSRTIVLLSDGAYNIGDDPAETAYLDTTFVDNDIHIYTIGMGTGSDNVNHSSLQNISTGTDTPVGTDGDGNPFGFTTYNLGDTASEPNLFPFVEKIMGDMISLDFIADPPGTIKPNSKNVHKFLITSHDELLSFTVSWESSQADLLDFYITTPDKNKMEPQVSGNGYRNITINREVDKKFSKNGEWILTIINKSKKTPVTYNYSVMTRSNLNMRMFLNKGKYYTGDTMLIQARLIENNIRFKGTAKVIATIERPESGIGDWFRKNSVSEKELKKLPDKRSKEPFSMLDKKRHILEKDKRKKLPGRIKDSQIILHDDGKNGDKYADDGIYSARFPDFAIPGIYKFKINADGTTRNKQNFHRETEIQKYIDIGVSPKDTIVEGGIVERAGRKIKVIRIRVTPVDKYKNHLGPGYANTIRIKVSDGKPKGEVTDLLDGTYEQHFELAGSSKEPTVTAVVKGVIVYRGPFSKLKKIKK